MFILLSADEDAYRRTLPRKSHLVVDDSGSPIPVPSGSPFRHRPRVDGSLTGRIEGRNTVCKAR
jgi:hypothetical protein